MQTINTRADLEALIGQPDYAAALKALLGATFVWTNTGTPNAPVWQKQAALDQIMALGFLSVEDLLAECAAVGIAPPSQDPPPAPVSPLASPEFVHAAKLRVAAFADEMAAVVTGPVPESERASWPTKEVAARAVLSGSGAPYQIAMLQAECDLTGEALMDLAAKIVENAEKYIVISGLIAGQRRVVMAALDEMAFGTVTVAEVEAVLVSAREQAEAMLSQILDSAQPSD
jgi:hypothetical protein